MENVRYIMSVWILYVTVVKIATGVYFSQKSFQRYLEDKIIHSWYDYDLIYIKLKYIDICHIKINTINMT